MPGGGDSIRYKSVVVGLLSICIALISFIGGGALMKLDRLETTVISLQAGKTTNDMRADSLERTLNQLSARMDFFERQLGPSIQYLTRWMEDTFGSPKPKSKMQFERQ